MTLLLVPQGVRSIVLCHSLAVCCLRLYEAADHNLRLALPVLLAVFLTDYSHTQALFLCVIVISETHHIGSGLCSRPLILSHRCLLWASRSLSVPHSILLSSGGISICLVRILVVGRLRGLLKELALSAFVIDVINLFFRIIDIILVSLVE